MAIERTDQKDFAALMQQLDAFIATQKDEKGALMPVMQKAQELFGYLPEETQKHIAKALGVTSNEVYGVATFYAQFALEPQGRYQIGVCMGTACYVKNSQKILDAIVSEIGVTSGKTTPDNKFTLVATRCVGACGLAPVIMIGEDVYGRLTPEEIPGILAKYADK